MKNIHQILSAVLPKKAVFTALLAAGIGLSACTDELPGEGSIPDLTPPKADFNYKSSTSDFRQINFSNTSISAISYTWDFGDGNTSTDKNPSYLFKAGEGTYKVSLTAKDGNNKEDKVSHEVVLVDVLLPEFLCAGFECSDRKVWGSYSGSGSPTPPEGSSGAKLESASHYLDQTITVRPNKKYRLSFYYVSGKTTGENCGNLLVTDGKNESLIFVKQAMPLTAKTTEYVLTTFSFTSGPETEKLRFRYTPGDVAVRLDDVRLTKIE